MGLFDFLKRGQVNSTMSENIENIFYNYNTELAYNMFNSDAEKDKKLNLPKAIVNTIVLSASQEFDFTINSEVGNLKKLAKVLKGNLKKAERDLCIGGQIAFKPYVKNNKVGISVYNARDFVAYYNMFGELEKIYFKSDIRESEYSSFTLVEIHSYDENKREYRIDYQLYKNNNTDELRKLGKQAPLLGSRVPLNKCSKTAELNDFVVIEDIDRHLCSVVCLDNSLTYNKGESIYASSIGLIQDAERQYDSLIWEYEGGELAIDASADLFKPAGSSRGKYVLPEGKERLYRRLEGADSDFKMNIFDPTLRDTSYINGLNEIIRIIETNTSLYYGAISKVDTVEKSATEIIASKQRFYVCVMDIKERMRVGIQESIENCCTLYNRMVLPFLQTSISIEFNIGDSVLDIVDNNKNIVI